MASTINGTQTGNGGLVTSGDDSGILQLQTNETTAVTIDASQDVTVANDLFVTGNVGIGTSSPAQSLDINRATDSRVRLLVNGTATGQIQAVSGDMRVHALGAIPLTFWTDSGERARIDSSGNLLVGTTVNSWSASMRMVVRGGKGATFISTGGASSEAVACWNIADSGTRYQIYFGDSAGGGVRGSISTNGSSTTYSTSSDYRLKENIAPMTGALSVVQQLKPCTYRWKESGENSQGFIAHELQAVVPDAVTGEKDAVNEDGSIKPQGIDTSFLVATLTAAIQELKAELDAAKERITALEGATQ